MSKLKLKPDSEINWTSLEFSRRITENLIKHQYIEQAEMKKFFGKMREWVIKEKKTLAEMRALSASVARHVTARKRDKSAREILAALGYTQQTVYRSA